MEACCCSPQFQPQKSHSALSYATIRRAAEEQMKSKEKNNKRGYENTNYMPASAGADFLWAAPWRLGCAPPGSASATGRLKDRPPRVGGRKEPKRAKARKQALLFILLFASASAASSKGPCVAGLPIDPNSAVRLRAVCETKLAAPSPASSRVVSQAAKEAVDRARRRC